MAAILNSLVADIIDTKSYYFAQHKKQICPHLPITKPKNACDTKLKFCTRWCDFLSG
jgi:hypothetical protein